MTGALFFSGCATRTATPTASNTPPAAVTKPLKLGLALGGGAARGFAHVGVIAVLEEAGLRPQLVVGTSAGSLVAALYASGKTSAQLQQTALNMDEVAITDWMMPIIGRGMFRGDALARYVNELVAGRLMENMAMPLGIVATDLGQRQCSAVSKRRYRCGGTRIKRSTCRVCARQNQWPRIR